LNQSLAYVSLLVADYDEAIAFFTEVLSFTLVEDIYVEEQQKRWIRVAPPGTTGGR
jgi:catechol 2,3-dioxygenase-like lactoylglutathione lyase family enzyme